MTFFDYMMRYLKKDTPAGDLARDMHRGHKNFPSSDNGKVIMEYLISKGAWRECLDTFKKCYVRYVRYELSEKYKEVDNG